MIKNVSVNTNAELVLVECEEVEETTMMLEPEETSKDSELITRVTCFALVFELSKYN